MGMTPGIAVESVPHVHEFFSDNDLQRPGLFQVDALEIDEDGVVAGPAEVAVGAAIGGRNTSSYPLPVGAPARGHPQAVNWQVQQINVSVEETGQTSVALVEEHQRFDPAWFVAAHGVRVDPVNTR